jgi:hypothetical protein
VSFKGRVAHLIQQRLKIIIIQVFINMLVQQPHGQTEGSTAAQNEIQAHDVTRKDKNKKSPQATSSVTDISRAQT